jgi:hypothetical protein
MNAKILYQCMKIANFLDKQFIKWFYVTVNICNGLNFCDNCGRLFFCYYAFYIFYFNSNKSFQSMETDYLFNENFVFFSFEVNICTIINKNLNILGF